MRGRSHADDALAVPRIPGRLVYADRVIDPATLVTYLAIVVGFVFLPGPATVMTVARSSTSGTKAGVATGAGIAAGDLVHTMMAIVGVSALIAASATLFTLVKYLGAAYLIVLGVRAIVQRLPEPGEPRVIPLTARRAFRQAVLAEILNPKTALFFLAFLPQFVAPERGSVALQLAVLGVLFVALGFLSTLVFAVTAGALGGFLRRNRAIVRWQPKVVGGVYCALGARLALQER